MSAPDHRMRVSEILEQKGVDTHWLALEACLGERIVAAICKQQYTPSPSQRRYIAEALQVDCEDILWGHAIEADSLKDPV